MQAELSSTADKEQEAYRSYMLRRMLPALQRFYTSTNHGEAGLRDEILRAAASASTARLEDCLKELYRRLLTVRTPFHRGRAFPGCKRVHQQDPMKLLGWLPYLCPQGMRHSCRQLVSLVLLGLCSVY